MSGGMKSLMSKRGLFGFGGNWIDMSLVSSSDPRHKTLDRFRNKACVLSMIEQYGFA